MRKIGILGRGTMSSGIVQTFAEKNYDVTMWVRSIDEENPRGSVASIDKALNRQVQKGKITNEHMDNTLNNIRITTSYEELKECDLIIEAISEDMKTKKEVFSTLDNLCKKSTILATNTSSLSITEIANSTNRADRVIGMHFFNPVPVMKLVEVIKGIYTSDETRNAIFDISNDLGKTPVDVLESPGFIVNRILVPMINEAVGIYAEGIASANDIDEAMKLGANHPMGPLALGDLIGLDVCLAIMDVLYNEFGDSKYRAHPLLRKMVRGNQLGRKTKKGFYEY
ncbi:3-hydroxybutyryl-CoA dehydrogenase [Tissierella sp. Yu-01]|uniref:3-hydroxybutyryl-CoA dehydrogenase n=1 Tax=Tissierella sp. Yu-01 TaxID=3035694 RepID=UPI00240DA469|nr:3-hydroxybutyryl-CoA dehydrogenase [Tissierella sp. Yu-01]WFA10032.1 3-hydroxybutyryl-CoA dehydrogenase [Tissierella sp. Yu-01]